MPSALRCLVAMIALAALVPIPARATVIAFESFDYPAPSSLIGKNGGFGFAGPWYITSASGKSYAPQSLGAACTIASPGMTYSGLGSCAGRCNTVNSGADHRAYRDLNLDLAQRPELVGLVDNARLGANGATIWIGFLGGLASGTASVNTNGAWHLYDGIDPFNVQDGDKLAHEKVLVGDRNQAVVWTIENTRQNNPQGLTNNNFNNLHYDAPTGPAANTVSTTPAFLAVRIDFRPVSAVQVVGEERIRIWINPPLNADPSSTTPTIDTDTPAYGGMFKDFRFDIFEYGSIGETMSLDELRITTTFAELVASAAPTITSQPVGGPICAAHPLALSVAATPLAGSLTYQWRKNGVRIAGPAAALATFVVPTPAPADAGSYDCVVASSLGSCYQTTSAAAAVAICPVDFNCAGGVNVQDIFDFLAAWFASDVRTDFNGNSTINVQDIFDFLAAWFVGC